MTGAGDANASGLRRLATGSVIIAGLAFDHRDSLDALLAEVGVSLTPGEIRDVKREVVEAIGDTASAVMLDHDYGRLAIAAVAARGGPGLIVPLEAQGYAQLGDDRTTSLLPDFGPADARALGAVGCKLLLPVRADRRTTFDRQLATARQAVEATKAAGLVAVLEPQVFRLSTETPAGYAERALDLVLAATAALADLAPDLLKLPFPLVDAGSRDADARSACAALHVAATGVPWVLYGAGVSAETFAWQLRHAGAAGANGFLVGRTIWRDALVRDPAARRGVARDVCAPRFAALAALAGECCAALPSTRQAR